MRTAAILAGGRARRLGGRSKALLPIGDHRIIDHQISVLRSVADQVAIVALDRDRYDTLGVPVWTDRIPNAGPLGGIYTALVNATAPRVLVVAGDLPFVTARFLAFVQRAGRDVDVAIPRTDEGYQPLCACYATSCAPTIRTRLDRGALKVSDALRDFVVREIGPDEIAPLDPESRVFFNINTPADYARCLEQLTPDA